MTESTLLSFLRLFTSYVMTFTRLASTLASISIFFRSIRRETNVIFLYSSLELNKAITSLLRVQFSTIMTILCPIPFMETVR